jgi:hypothetical protein
VRQFQISIPLRTVDKDFDDWKEHEHKRDASGKFSKMAEKVGLPASSGKEHGVEHEFHGQHSWKLASQQLTGAGFKPDVFTKHSNQGEYASTQTFKHPLHGHTAQISYSELMNGAKNGLAKLAILPGKPGAAPAAAQTPSTVAPPPSVPAVMPAAHHAKVAAILKPDPNSYASPNVKVYTANLLKKFDMALASSDPVKNLGALHVSKNYPKFLAYKLALLKSLDPTANVDHFGKPIEQGKGKVSVNPSLKQLGKMGFQQSQADWNAAHPIQQTFTAKAAPAPPPAPSGPATNTATVTTLKGETFAMGIHSRPDLIHKGLENANYSNTSGDWYTYAYETRASSNPSHIAALDSYQGSDYKYLNRMLAGIEAEKPSYRGMSDKLDALMEKNVLPADIITNRGISATLKDVIGTDDAASAVGGVFEHKGFVSSSRNSGFHGQTKLVITNKKGQPGVALKSLSAEAEILLPRSSMYRVDKIEKAAGGVSVVHCTYIGVRKDAYRKGQMMHDAKKKAPPPRDEDAESDAAQFVWHGKVDIQYGKWEPVGGEPKPAPKSKD